MEDRIGRGLRSLTNGVCYELGNANILGKGTYGCVYGMEVDGKKVAVKVAMIKSGGFDSSMLCELAALNKLHHSNIVEVLDVLVGEKCMAMVMPQANKTLEQYRNEKWGNSMNTNTGMGMNPEVLLEFQSIIQQLASGVAYMHDMDVLHGDLKSSNVLLYYSGSGCGCDSSNNTPKCRAVLIDYGLASAADCYEPTKCKHLFTIWYRPPELLLGGKYTTHSDTWALGCMAAELLTGRPPFIAYETDQRSVYTMLFLQFKRLGMPDENSWPEALLLPNWTAKTIQGIEEAKQAHHYASKWYTIPEMCKSVSMGVRYAYTHDGIRVPLPSDQQGFLSRMLALVPSSRTTPRNIADEDEWLAVVRQPITSKHTLTNNTLTNRLARLRGDYYPIGSPVIPLSLQMFSNAIQWIFSLCNELVLSERCVFYAINLFNRYACYQEVQGVSIAPLAAASIRLATSMTTGVSIYIDEICALTTLGIGEVTNMEQKLVEVVWKYLGCSTLYDMVRVYTMNETLMVIDASKTFVMLVSTLPMYTTLINTTPINTTPINTSTKEIGNQEVLAMMCVMLGCSACKQPFLLRQEAIQIGADRIVESIEWFGSTLGELLDILIESSRNSLLSSRPGSSLSPAACILAVPVIAQYVHTRQLVASS